LVTQLKTLTQLCFQPACHPVNPNAPPEELWEPEGASYYNGELILARQRWTLEQQLELLDTHSLFTGQCPRCEITYPKYETPPIHWDCSECGWMDDSVWGDGSQRFCFGNGSRYLLSTAFMQVTFLLRFNKFYKEFAFLK
jgi:hypothetical protein